MKPLISLMRQYSSCCLNCGSFLSQSSLLCAACDRRLRVYERGQQPKNRTLLIRPLYGWNPGESDLLSKLILSLKGSHQKEAWTQQAQRFTKKYYGEVRPQGRIFIVPAPTRNGLKEDHSAFWAQALAQCFGAIYLPCLEKVSTHSQKEGGRGERGLIELRVREIFSESEVFSSEDLWIFADDIVTTGSTAWAAYQALGSPSHFEVWALAERSLSCGASKDLL